MIDAGEQVQWPEGACEFSARRHRKERKEKTGQPASKLRKAQPERARATDSTLGGASVRVQPPAAAAPARQPAPNIVWALGPGHDLRLSGEVIWCRKCGRYGEERIKKGMGIGGPCSGGRNVAHTQLNSLRKGSSPANG